MERNQYPPDFYEPIIKKTLQNIVGEDKPSQTNDVRQESPPQPSHGEPQATNPEDAPRKKMIFIQYRGKCTEAFARALHRCKAPLHRGDDPAEAEKCVAITETFGGERNS